MQAQLLSLPHKSSPHFQKENSRIIKLIRQKIYPLQKSKTAKLLFPKILRKMNDACFSNDRGQKKYIEIEVKEDQGCLYPQRTDIEEELRYNLMNKKESHAQGKKSHRKIVPSVHYPLEFKESLNQSYQIVLPFSTESEQSRELTIRQEQLIKQEQKNHHYLSKIKEQINDSKRRYLNSIKISEILDNSIEKENCSFQFLVNRLQCSLHEEPGKKVPISAYENISPNKLSNFLQLFESNPKNRRTTMMQELQEITEAKPEERQEKVVRARNKKYKTIVQQRDDMQSQKVTSKLRLKGNHRKLIEIHK